MTDNKYIPLSVDLDARLAVLQSHKLLLARVGRLLREANLIFGTLPDGPLAASDTKRLRETIERLLDQELSVLHSVRDGIGSACDDIDDWQKEREEWIECIEFLKREREQLKRDCERTVNQYGVLLSDERKRVESWFCYAVCWGFCVGVAGLILSMFVLWLFSPPAPR